jgi:hypothetical protein
MMVDTEEEISRLREIINKSGSLSIEEYTSEAYSLAMYCCPKPFDFKCEACEHRRYCEILWK